MILLNFAVRNHKSIRDEVALNLTRPSLRTLTPRSGESWESSVFSIAGIFGANATGKSAILDALYYTFSAIAHSSTSWQSKKRIPRVPFLLDDSSAENASLYEIDFVNKNTRYLYGFEIDSRGISREWLKDVPKGRWRTLLERDRELGTLKSHPSIRKIGTVTDRELVLSRAFVVNHEQLGPIATDLIKSFDHVSVKDTHRERRLASIADSLMEGQTTFHDIVALLQVADIGVDDVSVEEQDLPKKFKEALQDFQRALIDAEGSAGDSDKEGDLDSNAVKEKLEEGESDAVVRSLLFKHRGEAASIPKFSIQHESDGTIAWLALMVPALEALRNGGIYCVDEIDSSLHPHLLDIVLGIFADSSLNSKGAQLIFTSHESYILSPLSDITMDPEQIWFTDKSYSGVTELSCLADFPRHRDANVAKRYLLGRYGGTPRLAPRILAGLVNQGGE